MMQATVAFILVDKKIGRGIDDDKIIQRSQDR
jgi:hypothetical protein